MYLGQAINSVALNDRKALMRKIIPSFGKFWRVLHILSSLALSKLQPHVNIEQMVIITILGMFCFLVPPKKPSLSSVSELYHHIIPN